MNDKNCPECGSDHWAKLNTSYWGRSGVDHMNAHLCQNKWHSPPKSGRKIRPSFQRLSDARDRASKLAERAGDSVSKDEEKTK